MSTWSFLSLFPFIFYSVQEKHPTCFISLLFPLIITPEIFIIIIISFIEPFNMHTSFIRAKQLVYVTTKNLCPSTRRRKKKRIKRIFSTPDWRWKKFLLAVCHLFFFFLNNKSYFVRIRCFPQCPPLRLLFAPGTLIPCRAPPLSPPRCAAVTGCGVRLCFQANMRFLSSLINLSRRPRATKHKISVTAPVTPEHW